MSLCKKRFVAIEPGQVYCLMGNHYHLMIDDDFVEQMRSKLGERDEDVNIPRVQQRGPAPKLRPYVGNTRIGTTRFGQVRDRSLQLSRNSEGIWSSFHHSGENCAPANEASERNPRDKVADGRLCYGNRPDPCVFRYRSTLSKKGLRPLFNLSIFEISHCLEPDG